MQLPSRFSFGTDLVGVLPPDMQMAPPQTLDGDLTVIDEGVVRIPADDLDVVVDRRPKDTLVAGMKEAPGRRVAI